MVFGVMRVLCLLLILCSCAAQGSTAPDLGFRADTIGGPDSNRRAELYLPAGAGPFSAIIILHGCDGVGPHYRSWARQLRDWGYAAMLVNSFGPRGVSTVCNHPMIVPPMIQAQDAFAAADYLRGLPNIRADRIGVIGFSHGGWAVLKAVLEDTVREDGATPFVAAVAFYPGCQPPASALATDTLILIGDADDWSSPTACKVWYDSVQKAGHAVQLKVYPGALHGFDALHLPSYYAGHYTGRDPAAAADATSETREFLAKRLGQ
jgi:dienelactone hydrolase